MPRDSGTRSDRDHGSDVAANRAEPKRVTSSRLKPAPLPSGLSDSGVAQIAIRFNSLRDEETMAILPQAVSGSLVVKLIDHAYPPRARSRLKQPRRSRGPRATFSSL